jgi:hypothetical protein
MGKVCVAVRVALGLILSGCGSTGLIDLGNRPTQVNPLPVKTALKESAVVIAIPAEVQKKPTSGYRSLIDIQFEVLLTEPDGIDVPLAPNGLVVGIKGRW